MKILLCIPGANFSREFIIHFIQFINQLQLHGITFMIRMQYSPVVHFARAQCLGGNVLGQSIQIPMNGEFDFIFWIDSDIVFQYEQFERLLQMDKDVVAGWYSMADATNTPIVESFDDEYFIKMGSYRFLPISEIVQRTDPFSCAYVGMGFFLMKSKVFEKITYPWFYEPAHTFPNGTIEMMSEDVSFCQKLRNAGFTIWVDPTVRVGHQKLMIL